MNNEKKICEQLWLLHTFKEIGRNALISCSDVFLFMVGYKYLVHNDDVCHAATI